MAVTAMNFFFQEVKGQKTLLITSTRFRIQISYQEESSGGRGEDIWESSWAGGDLGHLACPQVCAKEN